jgi:hypothetical protein
MRRHRRNTQPRRYRQPDAERSAMGHSSGLASCRASTLTACPLIGAHSANSSALEISLQASVSPAHQELRRSPRDSGTADARHKRLARQRLSIGTPKESLATESNDVRVQGSENARQFALRQDRKHMLYQELTSWRWGQSSANLSQLEFSLLSGKIQGNFRRSGLKNAIGLSFRTRKSEGYGQIPHASEQGIFRSYQVILRAYQAARDSNTDRRLGSRVGQPFPTPFVPATARAYGGSTFRIDHDLTSHLTGHCPDPGQIARL